MIAAILAIFITYSGPPTALAGWFESLKSPGGGFCCAEADGQDTEYDTADGHYRVPLDGKMVEVPDDRVITEPNLHGHAMVWFDYQKNIRCFIPGAQT